jgi:hypothetical protein
VSALSLPAQVTWADFADQAWVQLQALFRDKPFDDESDASPWCARKKASSWDKLAPLRSANLHASPRHTYGTQYTTPTYTRLGFRRTLYSVRARAVSPACIL